MSLSNPVVTSSMPTRDRIATPFHWLWPWCTESYPRAENASAGNASSAYFVSCMHNTSGFAYSSHSSTRGWRAFNELTFHVAIRIDPNDIEWATAFLSDALSRAP